MAADVVRPPTIPNVARSYRELGLEGKRLPRCDSVARETNRISVAARSCIAGEDHRVTSLRSFSLFLKVGIVVEVKVVQDPEGINAAH